MPTVRALWAFLALACLGACSSKSNGVGDGGVPPVLFVGRACNEDLECGSLRCDKVRRQCICLSDESCRPLDPTAPARYCNNYTGLCVDEVAGCTGDDQCAASEFCDSKVRSCRSLRSFCDACGGDSECGGAGDDCSIDGGDGRAYCSKACATTVDCPRGAECVSLGGKLQCAPRADAGTSGTEGSACKDFRGCTPDSRRTCNNHGDCEAQGDQRCDPGSGRCVAIERVCPFGTVCDPRNRICVAECTQDVDCGDPKLRCNERVCEPVGECATDDHCPANKVCNLPPGQSAGQCVPFCQTDLDCPLGKLCQKGRDDRYRCVEGCFKSQDCRVDQRCNAATHQCEGPTVGTARVCQATSACNACELCEPTTAECVSAKSGFPHCAPCTNQGQCTGGACVQLQSGGATYCAQSCSPGQECPQGFVCLTLSTGTQSVCVPSDKQCANKCP